MQLTTDSLNSKKDLNSEKRARLAEVRFSGFIAEYIFHLLQEITERSKSIFPDSKVAKSYTNQKAKAACILNRAICPDLALS